MFSADQRMDCRGADRADRADHRIAVDTLATLLHQGRTLTARLQNLSRNGAGLWAAVPPPKDARVTLALGDRSVAARVAWADSRRFGLSFENSLRATDVFLVSGRSRIAAD